VPRRRPSEPALVCPNGVPIADDRSDRDLEAVVESVTRFDTDAEHAVEAGPVELVGDDVDDGRGRPPAAVVAHVDGLPFSIDWLPDGQLLITTPNGFLTGPDLQPYAATRSSRAKPVESHPMQ
jgi:hypothetical protein